MADTKTVKDAPETSGSENGSAPASAGLEGFEPDQLLGMLRSMLLFRRFEGKAEEAYAIGKIGGFCHLHIGQEAAALGCIGPLRDDDYVITAYREHTQALAKGMEPNAVMAELYGKKAGCSHGKGGSMHIFSADHNFMGGHGIVGGQIPLGAGIGFAIKYRGEDKVCVCFMGDAAVNQGAFHEALNMAAIWSLPVIFVVENNEYGMGTAFSRVSSKPVSERAEGYGIPSSSVNGQDVLEVWSHMAGLIDEVRAGGGPRYVDVRTYRFKGHSMSDPVSGTYRSKEEVESKKEEADPITLLRSRLIDADLLTKEELEAMDEEVRALCQEAADFADEAPEPEPGDLYLNVYSHENPHGRLYFDGRDREE